MGNQRLKWALVDLPTDSEVPTYGDILTQIESASLTGGVFSLPDAGLQDTNDYGFQGLDDCHIHPRQILVSSVNCPEVNAHLDQYCTARWRHRPWYVNAEAFQLGLRNEYENPSQLGSDRWLAVLAGYIWSREWDEEVPLVVVDAGTAVTVDLVSDHRFEGGAILPGLTTIVQKLAKDTGSIHIDVQKVIDTMGPDSLNIVARNSNDAVNVGAVLSVIGGIDRYLAHIQHIKNSAPVVLVTGGDAQLVAALSQYPMKVFRNLVISGLRWWRSSNRDEVDCRNLDDYQCHHLSSGQRSTGRYRTTAPSGQRGCES